MKSQWDAGMQECKDGAVVRALASHQCGPGSIDPASCVG